jgi:hypothetical protein
MVEVERERERRIIPSKALGLPIPSNHEGITTAYHQP